MKNWNGILFLGIFLLVSLVSATPSCGGSFCNMSSYNISPCDIQSCVGMTLVRGIIYSSDTSAGISDASVEVSCNGHVESTISFLAGEYAVLFNQSECGKGDTVSVYASHPDYGANSRSGVVSDTSILVLDLATVNVPLVPEFGAVVGVLTMLSAVGLFFVVRKD